VLGLQNHALGFIASKTLHRGYCKDEEGMGMGERGREENGKEEEEAGSNM